MNNSLKYFLSGAGAAVIIFLLSLSWTKDLFRSEIITIAKTDTVYIDKPYREIEIKYVEKPVKVYVYKTDTVYRKLIEKDTLITSVEITPTLAKIHTLTPKGLPLISEYPVLEYRELKIDHEGNFQLKRKKKRGKKFFRALERIVIFTGGVLIGNQLSKPL